MSENTPTQIPIVKLQPYVEKIHAVYKKIQEFSDYQDDIKREQFQIGLLKEIQELDIPKSYYKKDFVSFGTSVLHFGRFLYEKENQKKREFCTDFLLAILNKEVLSTKIEHWTEKEISHTNMPSAGEDLIANLMSSCTKEQFKKINPIYLNTDELKEKHCKQFVELQLQGLTSEVTKILPKESLRANYRYRLVDNIGEQAANETEEKVLKLIENFFIETFEQIKVQNVQSKNLFFNLLKIDKIERNLNQIKMYLPEYKKETLPVWFEDFCNFSFKNNKNSYSVSSIGLAFDLTPLKNFLPKEKKIVIEYYEKYLEEKNKLDFIFNLVNENFDFLEASDWDFCIDWIKNKKIAEKPYYAKNKWDTETKTLNEQIDFFKNYHTRYNVGGLYLLQKLGCTDIAPTIKDKKLKYEFSFYNTHAVQAWKEIFNNLDLHLNKKNGFDFLKINLQENLSEYTSIPQVKQLIKKFNNKEMSSWFPMNKRSVSMYKNGDYEEISVEDHLRETQWKNIKALFAVKNITPEEVLKKLILNDKTRIHDIDNLTILCEKLNTEYELLEKFFRKNSDEILRKYVIKESYEKMPKKYSEILVNNLVYRKKETNYYSNSLNTSFMSNSNYLSKHGLLNSEYQDYLIKKIKDPKINFSDFEINAKILLNNRCPYEQEIYQALLEQASHCINKTGSSIFSDKRRMLSFSKEFFKLVPLFDSNTIMTTSSLDLLAKKEFIAEFDISEIQRSRLLDKVHANDELPTKKLLKL